MPIVRPFLTAPNRPLRFKKALFHKPATSSYIKLNKPATLLGLLRSKRRKPVFLIFPTNLKTETTFTLNISLRIMSPIASNLLI
jgi:hypothetical protein